MILSLNGILAGRGVIPSTLLTSLVSVYKAESNANDSLGTNNGTGQGGLTYSTGKSGNAFTGNGSTAYVSLPNNSLNSLTGDFSFSFWVYLTSATGVQAILWNKTYDGSNFYGWALINNNQYWVFSIGNGTNDIQLQAPSFTATNTWYNVVITRLGSTRSRMYVNGSLVNNNSSTINPNFNSNMTPSIAVANFGPTFSNTIAYYLSNNSKIDELNVWNKELTATEVTELYNSGVGKFYPF